MHLILGLPSKTMVKNTTKRIEKDTQEISGQL